MLGVQQLQQEWAVHLQTADEVGRLEQGDFGLPRGALFRKQIELHVRNYMYMYIPLLR